MNGTARKVWIFGDSPLVEQLAAVCLNSGHAPRVRINGEGTKHPLPAGSQAVDESDTAVDAVFELTNISTGVKLKNLSVLDELLPDGIPILSSSVTSLASEQATWLAKPQRHIGVGAFPTLFEHEVIELAPSHKTTATTREAAASLVTALGKSPAFVADAVGMVMPRILCALINEATYALLEGIAEAKDIDTAMKLGTNYPHGPVEWGERIGPRHVLAVMSALYHHYGEERYRPSAYLKRAAYKGTFA